MSFTVSVRQYLNGGILLGVSNQTTNKRKVAVKAANRALTRDNPAPSVAPINPCNISVRGKGGRFVKWKNK